MVVVPLAAGRDELFGELRVLTFVGTCTVHAVLVHWLSPEGAKCGQWVSRSKARNGGFVVWELEQRSEHNRHLKRHRGWY